MLPPRAGKRPISDFSSVVLPMPLRPMTATASSGRDAQRDIVDHVRLAIG
jgi:hypothetical protein